MPSIQAYRRWITHAVETIRAEGCKAFVTESWTDWGFYRHTNDTRAQEILHAIASERSRGGHAEQLRVLLTLVLCRGVLVLSRLVGCFCGETL